MSASLARSFAAAQDDKEPGGRHEIWSHTFTFRGFHGTYELTVSPSVGAPATSLVTLAPGKNPATFTVNLK